MGHLHPAPLDPGRTTQPTGRCVMDIPGTVQAEWHEGHILSRQALRLIRELADPDDTHPIASALDQMRTTEVQLGEQ
jgi:hypothetical protein